LLEHYPAIAAVGGGYIIAWENGQTGDLCAQRFDSGGNEVGTLITLKQDVSGSNDGPAVLTGMPDGCYSACKFDPLTGGIGVQN